MSNIHPSFNSRTLVSKTSNRGANPRGCAIIKGINMEAMIGFFLIGCFIGGISMAVVYGIVDKMEEENVEK